MLSFLSFLIRILEKQEQELYLTPTKNILKYLYRFGASIFEKKMKARGIQSKNVDARTVRRKIHLFFYQRLHVFLWSHILDRDLHETSNRSIMLHCCHMVEHLIMSRPPINNIKCGLTRLQSRR